MPTEFRTNVLHIGDNLEVLRGSIPDESVDLVYLDPPFNTNRSYSLIFNDEAGLASDAQQFAFDDSWHWGPRAEATFSELVAGTIAGADLASLVTALVSALNRTPMTAYLVEMAVRLVELHRVLKPTGSLYLHCDPTASHYLKTLLDAVFGPRQFVNEIVWKRQTSHNDAAQGARHYGRLHDVILFYAKGPTRVWHQPYRSYDQTYTDRAYRHIEPGTGRRYTLSDITAPGGPTPAKGNPHYVFLGIDRWWRFSEQRMHQLYA